MRVIPPLSQSLNEKGSCSEGYVFEVIDGNKQPDAMQSDRGSEIHHILSEYVRHCVKAKVAVDFPYFDKLAAAAGPEAGPILDGMRDTFVVDYKHVLATEVRLRLDRDLNPTITEEHVAADGLYEVIDHDEDEMVGVPYSGCYAAHAGTLDVILINDDATEGIIPDYKSHPRPFEPETYQSMLYPFMAFKHIPTLRKVTFRLVFVRWGAEVTREVTWVRDEMPDMAIQLRRARERQLALEAAGEGPALPGSHCQYCPKMAKPTLCSIADFNPQINTKMEERLRFNVWAAEQAKVNRQVMKDAVDASGKPIVITDANGKQITFGAKATESLVFPLDPTFIKITENQIAVSTDTWESMKLRVSSTKLKGLMKAKKREGYKSALENSVAEMEVKVKMGICKPDSDDVDTGYSQEDDF
ncbi:MAG TPA: PD-(D/E)XK nuclease family protein [Edaphobacter sp.]|nr:PD-(D/E)XK nuclease family protein [Edaphobacter sp.]